MLLQVLLSSLLLFTNCAIAAASYPGCAMLSWTGLTEANGYDREIYELSYTEPEGKISDELLSYFAKTVAGRIGLTNLYDIGFNISIPSGEVYRGDFQDQKNVLLSHMAVVFGATLVVPETGEYTFSLDGSSDGAAMFILDNLDLLCCENADNTNSHIIDAFSKFYYIPDDPSYQTKSITVNLVAGISYQLYFSYVNHDGDAIFKPTMTTPSREIITNFKGYIYNPFGPFCKTGNSTSSVASQWSETYPTTSTTIITNVGAFSQAGLPYTEIETIYYIMTPAPTSASSSVVSSSSKAAISSSLTSSSSLSESSLSSSSVILSSSEQSSTVSSQQTSSTASLVSLSSEKSSLTPSSSFVTSSSALSTVRLSDNKTEHISSTVSDAVTSSVVSSSEEASVSSFTQSSKISSSMHTVLSNLDGDSSTKQLTKSTVSSVFNTFTSRAASSNTKVFSNSSITEESTRSSTSYPSINSIQSNSPVESSGDAGQSGSEDYLTTSTYTDVYGMTRTTTVRCSTQSNDINPAGESHMPDVTVVTVTSCSNKKCETVVSTVARPTSLAKTTVTGKVNPQETATLSGYSGASSVASVAAQLQSSRGSSSATHTVQQVPNAAGKYTAGLLFSIVPIAFPLFFM